VPQCIPQLAHSVTSPLADRLPLSGSHNLPAKPPLSLLIWMPTGGS
jgi:hypothetical protein